MKEPKKFHMLLRSRQLTSPDNQFEKHAIDASCSLFAGQLPAELRWNEEQFDIAWNLHPAEYATVMMRGVLVKLPRFQLAYDRNYKFSGRLSKAVPLPDIFKPLLQWAQSAFNPYLNGTLLNWYEGSLGHYIGPHRDKTNGLVPASPIVTISFGETRTFRLRPWKGKGFTDFEATNGSVFVMPWETNKRWTHEITKSKRAVGKRISVTFRAFESCEGDVT